MTMKKKSPCRLIQDIQVNAIRQVKAFLKKNKLLVTEVTNWNEPSWIEFRRYGNDVKAWLTRCHLIGSLSRQDFEDVLQNADYYDFVTKEEVKEFKNKTWPKLFAKWEAEEKAERAEARAKNAKDSAKIKAKIARLQKQLESIES